MDWRFRGACSKEDPDLFFPIGRSGPAPLQIQDAKALCHICPVPQECRQWALDSGEDAGVWGGLSEEERCAIRRRVVPKPTTVAPVLPNGTIVADAGADPLARPRPGLSTTTPVRYG